jgi:hypothetical protein
MTLALKSLSFATLQRTSSIPTLDRRLRVIAHPEEQTPLKDPSYRRSVKWWKKNEGGESQMPETTQRILAVLSIADHRCPLQARENGG